MARTRTGLKQKKKVWYEIIAPREFNSLSIGETMSFNPDSLIGRKINLNLMSLTRNIKKQNMRVKFEIKQVKDGKALTELVSYNLIPAYVKRVVRTGRSKVGDSMQYSTKDGVKVKVKPLVLTKNIVTRSIVKSLRKESRKFLKEFTEKQDYDGFVSSVLSYGIQRNLRDYLKKICPIAICEIRVFEKI